ncbi:MAG: hypothetical protein RML95_06490 [Anaerolineae bacterium]|nr:hypothetical protein [Anaerolineae bacterium]
MPRKQPQLQPINRPDGCQAVGIDIGAHAIVIATQAFQKPIKISLKSYRLVRKRAIHSPKSAPCRIELA